MSVAFNDYDGDSFPDAFVTNDKLPNFLFHNIQTKRFEEAAFSAGVALPDDGKPISSMGAVFRDYNNDGRPDIAVVALSGETFLIFRNLGAGTFRDVTYASARHGAGQRHGGAATARASSISTTTATRTCSFPAATRE
jgi:hypothetical protein